MAVIVVGIIAIILVVGILVIALMGANRSSRRQLDEVEARIHQFVLAQRSPAERERDARRLRQIEEQQRQVHAAFQFS